jgi:hypothetical protein
MKHTVGGLLPVLALSCLSAHADTLLSYSDSGTFSPGTTSDALGFAAPSETWAFSFDATTNPTNVLVSGMGGFNFAFSNFHYSLNGSTVAITPTFVRFFPESNGSGFEICFTGTSVPTCTDALATGFFAGPQMFTGATSMPTLSRGPFTFTELDAIVDTNVYDLGNTTVQASGVPEPSTSLPLVAGLLALASRRLRIGRK